jgi:glycosyltransferase involved in cell wall biosynthesis
MIKNMLPQDQSSDNVSKLALPHILLVLDQFPESLGGGERIAIKLAELLPQYGYRASILTFGIHPKSSALLQAKCPIHLLPLQRVYDFNAVRASFALSRFLKKQKIQIVQTFFESSDLWAGLITKAMSQAKLIWSRRDMGILRATKHRIGYRLMAGVPDAIFAVSNQVRRHCIEVDHVDPDRIFTIYNGLDLAAWPRVDRYVKSPEHIVITSVGNVRRVKGHDVLVRAAYRIIQRYPGVQFQIVGDILEPEYFSELRELVSELHLHNNLQFVGGISNIAEYLAAADIFVLPSRSEGFSNAIIEAMSASLPVVATNVGGNAEAVLDSINGYLVESEDVEAMVAAIDKLLSYPARAIEMGAAGRQLVVERFTTEAMMKDVISSYCRLISDDK